MPRPRLLLPRAASGALQAAHWLPRRLSSLYQLPAMNRAAHWPLQRLSTLAQPPATNPPSAPTTSSPSELLAYYSQIRARAVTFSELQAYGVPPLSEATLLTAAERTRVQLLGGLARRVTDHLTLPYLPATNPSLQSIYQLYATAFQSLCAVPEIKTLKDNEFLCDTMAKMVEAHRDNIPTLAKGFHESRRYLPDSVITAFLDRAIRNRITMRLTAEQHLSLSSASLPALNSPSSPTSEPPTKSPYAYASPTSLTPTRIGVLDLKLSPVKLVRECAKFVSTLCEATYGVSPSFRIEGIKEDTQVGFIGIHAEYIVTELLKNAARATVEYQTPRLAPPAQDDRPSDSFRFDDLPSAHLSRDDFPPVIISIGVVPGSITLRIRDRGGGVAPQDVPNVFSYAFTTVPRLPDPDADPDSPYAEEGNAYTVGHGPGGPETALKTELGTLAGLGFGLPLSRLYAEYFGGSLELQSIYNWGTDVYVSLRTV